MFRFLLSLTSPTSVSELSPWTLVGGISWWLRGDQGAHRGWELVGSSLALLGHSCQGREGNQQSFSLQFCTADWHH